MSPLLDGPTPQADSVPRGWADIRRQTGLALLVLLVALVAETRASMPEGVADDVNNLLILVLGGIAMSLLTKRG